MNNPRQFAEQAHVDARVFERLAVLGTFPSDLWLEHVTDRLVAQIIQQHELEAEWAAMKHRELGILDQPLGRTRLLLVIALGWVFLVIALVWVFVVAAAMVLPTPS